MVESPLSINRLKVPVPLIFHFVKWGTKLQYNQEVNVMHDINTDLHYRKSPILFCLALVHHKLGIFSKVNVLQVTVTYFISNQPL